MFITNVLVGKQIVDRAIFWDLRKASDYAQEKTKHKVWEIDKGVFYYGDVEAVVYEPNLQETSDYQDEHILSFVRSI